MTVNNSDQEWFDTLYEKNFDKLMRIAIRVLHNEAYAEDIVQDVFLVCLCKIDKVKFHKAPDRWLVRTLKNLLGNELRRASKTRETALNDLTDIREATISALFIEILPQGLSSQELQLLTWYFNDQLSYEEIATRLNISVLALSLIHILSCFFRRFLIRCPHAFISKVIITISLSLK